MALQHLTAPRDSSTAIKAAIWVSPFIYSALDEPRPVSPADAESRLTAHFGRDFTLCRSGRHALDLILGDLRLDPDDVVTIVTTSGSDYVSSCVTTCIARHCQWSMAVERNTRAVIAIHEWGRPCERISEYVDRGFPVIEDCAYAFATRYADGQPVGRRGDYALFSLTKMFSANVGGVAIGPPGRDFAFRMEAGERDDVLSLIGSELADLDGTLARRRNVYDELAGLFGKAGALPYFETMSGEVPSVYMFAHDERRISLSELRRKFEAHGVEASGFWGHQAFYVPAHQRLGPVARQLLVDIYQQAINLSVFQ